MTIVHESDWHPFEAVLQSGCSAEGRICPSHCPEPCEDKIEIELDCDANGCPPNIPDGAARCAADHVVSEGIFRDEFDALKPGSYRLRYRLTRDYYGEYDEEIEITEPVTAVPNPT